MTQVAESTQASYLADYDAFERERGKADPAWLAPIRKAAISRFAVTGFPTTRQEEWRYTSVAPIANTEFRREFEGGARVTRENLKPFLFGGSGLELVFVNGRFAPALSRMDHGGGGLRAASIAASLEMDGGSGLQTHLARYTPYQTEPFAALNTAFMEDGAVIRVPRGRIVEAPVHILFVTTPGREPAIAHPRVLVVAGEDSQVAVVESYASLGDGRYFNNAVTELAAEANARIDHYRVQRESEQAFHVNTLELYQARTSGISSHSLSLGGALVRHNIHAVLNGEGADCTLNGLFAVHGRQHVDSHLRVEHVRRHCRSWEYYKGILDGESRGVFSGRILVYQDAQKTDAKQTNKNLLLSREAQVDTKPQLEIFADDVKCTHGATIGQIDKDALFYLRSRGLPEEAARELLIYAFASESLEQIRIEPLREQIAQALFSRLQDGAAERAG